MPYEDAPFERGAWHDPDVECPVSWREDVCVEQVDELFEQEMSQPDPALEDLDRHMSDAWERLAPLYEGEV
jgi:hypothetical protein